MKKCIIIFLIIIVSLSCKKHLFDYRNKYIGDWNFNVKRTEFNTDSIGYYKHDSVSYKGKIKYGDKDNNLLIQYTVNDQIYLTIDKDGNFSDFPSHNCSGSFDGKKKISLYFRWGGLGGGVTHIVNGEKEK